MRSGRLFGVDEQRHSKGFEGPFHVIKAGMMVEVEKAVDLRRVPANPPRQLPLAHTLVDHGVEEKTKMLPVKRMVKCLKIESK